MYSRNSRLTLWQVEFLGNQAPKGGGAGLLWGGWMMPLFPFSCVYASPRSDSAWPSFNLVSILSETVCNDSKTNTSLAFVLEYIERYMCGKTNTNAAMYGPCIASDYKYLRLFKDPADSSRAALAYPGLPFFLHAQKTDAYNQTVASDSSSIVQIFQSTDQASSQLKITGSTVLRLSSGLATFLISINPRFSRIDVLRQETTLLFEPKVYATGTDSQTIPGLSSTMRSDDVEIGFFGGLSVCPKGFILDLGQDSDGSASCTFCKPGSYSINPLGNSDAVSNQPSCLNCAVGGDCTSGGENVTFDVGSWERSAAMYIVTDCPAGYQLISSSSNGKFAHDVQECKLCQYGQYIIRPNVDTCQICPDGELLFQHAD